MANESKKEQEEMEQNAFDITKRVTVYATDLNKHVKTGEPMDVGLLVAKKLLANGMATDNPPKETANKKDK